MQKQFSTGVKKWIDGEIEKEKFSTGSKRFDSEWFFGTYMMAGMGFGQIILEHPEFKKDNLKYMEICIDKIMSKEGKTFDTDAWGEDPLENLENSGDHAAYLGYFNLLLSLHRLIEPVSKYSSLNDKITENLIKKAEKSPIMLLYTYPNELYPVDNCSIPGSIGLYDLATGKNHKEFINKWEKNFKKRYIEPSSGILYQSVTSDGKPLDRQRGSGTALGIYFLSFADKKLSEELYKGLKKNLAGKVLGFGAIKEYPRGTEGLGDIDSGPVILGYSFSATGFSLSGSRIHNDFDCFSSIYSTSYLIGCPLERNDERTYVMGGPLGNAIMFAMLTAQGDIKKPEK